MLIHPELASDFIEQLIELIPDRRAAARIAGAQDAEQLEAWGRGERLDELRQGHVRQLGYVHSLYLNGHDMGCHTVGEDGAEAWLQEWVKTPLEAAPFSGKSPLEHWLSGGWEPLQDTLDWQVDELSRRWPDHSQPI